MSILAEITIGAGAASAGLPGSGRHCAERTRPPWLIEIVLRHGATVSDKAGTDSMSRPNASAQRQLNEQGREQANRSESPCAS